MENLFTLVALTIVLVLIPGPNVALIVANSLKHGTRFGLITVAGTTLGVAMQLALVVLGLSAILALAASVLVWVKWVGVAYLVYLGFKAWREPAHELLDVKSQRGHYKALFWRGMGLAVINPKTLIFNAAFLPQFVSSGNTGPGQFLLVAGVFLLVLGLGDVLWAVFAGFARSYMARFNRLTNRVSGGFLMAAGAGLALARNE